MIRGMVVARWGVEFNLTETQQRGHQNWIDRPRRFCAVGEAQIDFRAGLGRNGCR